MKKTGPLFRSTQQTHQRLSVRGLRRRVDYYLKLAGLKKRGLSAHSLRSTSCTLALEAGATLLELQQHLNHASPETTIRYIGRLEQIKSNAGNKIKVKV